MKQWEEILEVPLPLPFSLKIIKAYVIKGKNGYTLIDTGLNTEEGWKMWNRVQLEGGWNWQNVEKIVLTHYHPDHYGLAGTIQQHSAAAVYISEKDMEQAQLFFGRQSDIPEVMARFFQTHGLDEELVHQIPNHLRSFQEWVEPHPKPSYIAEGDNIDLGDRNYLVYHTPGHSDGHLSFFDPKRCWLIGGDFLLPKITPNISLWPKCNENPLQTFLDTLDKMKRLPVRKVFPSHGSVFENYNERIEELKLHHQRRLEEMERLVQSSDGITAYEVCLHYFGNQLSIHNLRFALSETLAHLEYLRLNDKLSTKDENKKILYDIKLKR